MRFCSALLEISPNYWDSQCSMRQKSPPHFAACKLKSLELSQALESEELLSEVKTIQSFSSPSPQTVAKEKERKFGRCSSADVVH